MKIAIVGSRDYDQPGWILQLLERLGRNPNTSEITIVSGGARGVDKIAERGALEYGFRVISHPAEWAKYGRRAGFRRNHLIVSDADIVVAFWDGFSRGTMHSIDIAKSQGKVCYVVSNERVIFERVVLDVLRACAEPGSLE